MEATKADAPVVIYGFESLSCPHCRRFHIGAWPKIKKAFVETGKVRFVIRDFPHNAQGFFDSLLGLTDGVGHIGYAEKPEPFNAAVLDFLARSA